MEKIEYLGDRAVDLNSAFGKAITSLQGWAGGILTLFLSPGTIWLTILYLWAADLCLGTMLSRKAARIIASGEPADLPELQALISSGKVRGFSWSRWRLSLEKLATAWILVIGCEVFKLWLSHDRPWAIPGLDLVFSLIYFVLIFTDFRSCIRNAALLTANPLLLRVWKALGAHVDLRLRKALGEPNKPSSAGLRVKKPKTTNGDPKV